MKETYIRLSPEELQMMLQGSLLWFDVASQVNTSNTGIRKLDKHVFEKQPAPKQAEHPDYYPPKEKDKPSKRLEGKSVIWLLGGVGILTLSSWFYYVLIT